MLARICALAICAVALAACADTNTPDTALNWPVGPRYVVHDGDTLSGIAERYNVADADLVRYNGLDRPNHIYAGQVLYIPPAAYQPERQAPRAVERREPVRRAEPRREPVRLARREEPRAVPKPRPPYRQPRYAPSRAPEEPAAGAPHFLWPVRGRVILGFGATASGGRNDGINISATMDEPIRAAASGVVIYAGDELKSYGNLVLIKHPDGYITAYAHARDIVVERNDQVRAGQIIGHAGESGNVAAPQLHFEIRQGAHPVDPEPLLRGMAAG